MIKVKLLSSKATPPTFGTQHAAGIDLYSANPGSLTPGEYKSFATDIAVEIPEGYYGKISPRSGLATKYGIDTLAGVIDSDYRGHLIVVLVNNGKVPVTFNKGDRIAQMVIQPYYYTAGKVEIVENLSTTIRGEKGFGSTGT